MGNGQEILDRIAGTADEQMRRKEILRALLEAHAAGDTAAVTAELRTRIDGLKGNLADKLKALDKLLA